MFKQIVKKTNKVKNVLNKKHVNKKMSKTCKNVKMSNKCFFLMFKTNKENKCQTNS